MNTKNTHLAETIIQTRKMIENEEAIPVENVSILLIAAESSLERQKNSKNSSIPPSQDPNRNKESSSGESTRKPGGQPGRNGTNLKPIETPDEIIEIPIDRTSLPSGHCYTKVGVTKRQVVEIYISRHVKEYHLEIVEDEEGRQFTAKGPEGTSRPVQYGSSIKAMGAYMNQHQLIPYDRAAEYFKDQGNIFISSGSLFNFNKEAFKLLEQFESKAKKQLLSSTFLHSDETGININGKLHWLHGVLNDRWTLFTPHKKRGKEAMDEMDILPHFEGVLIHDHWKPYYTYTQCLHALCNAHHLRELEAMIENHLDHTWAQKMKDLLLEINKAVHKTDGVLKESIGKTYRKRYQEILKIGNKESPLPPPQELNKPKKRGRVKKSKERNLLERLRDFENDALRFMDVYYVPFTNNPGENDLRMTKVQQKISGCFRSFEGAQIFCRVRSYLLTAQKHGMRATEALNLLFSGKLPDFCLN